VITVILVWYSINIFGVWLGLVFTGVYFLSTGFIGYKFITSGLLIDVTWSLISQFITGFIGFYLRFKQQYQLRQQIKKQFEHYLDPRQVKQLQDNPELLKLGGERKYCTFLFTDVRGFTNLSEKLEPEEVTKIMNKALTIQAEAVKKYGGMVDKYIGDAMMAIFNAPIDLDMHEDRAILAAIEIKKEMQKADLGIAIGIGINSGNAVIGNMGSDTRFDFTAIGSDVNLAARCESSCKEVGKDIVIASNTATQTDIKLMKLKPIAMKGIAKPVEIYTVQEST
jgi:adenylate cyclase